MIIAQVVSPVIGTGVTTISDLSNSYRARLVDVPGVVILTDNTGGNAPFSPPFAVFTAQFTDEAFAAVQADTENYLINWSETVNG